MSLLNFIFHGLNLLNTVLSNFTILHALPSCSCVISLVSSLPEEIFISSTDWFASLILRAPYSSGERSGDASISSMSSSSTDFELCSLFESSKSSPVVGSDD